MEDTMDLPGCQGRRRLSVPHYFSTYYGLSLPTNLPFPNKKSIAFAIFLSILSSVFNEEIYLTISCFFEGENSSNIFFA
jgi:hypothetical protein